MSNARQGFTLIELSIVLVIIGLIVGGVLVGRDLIHAAELRATITQVEKFNSATNTFRNKYNGIPGDILGDPFGFTTRTGGFGRGDGNGIVQAESADPILDFYLCGEVIMFWSDLGDASLLDQQYIGEDGSSLAGTCVSYEHDQTKNVLPTSKFLSNNFWTVYYKQGNHFYQLFDYMANDGASIPVDGAIENAQATARPLDAFYIDNKIDNALPLTGIMQATDALRFDLAIAAAPAVGVCVSDASGNPYNTSKSTGGDQAACAFRIRASF